MNMNSSNMNRRSSSAIDGSHSLMTAINRFVQAVNTMDDTVMIPCRLRDIDLNLNAISDLNKEDNNNNNDNDNNKAVVQALHANGDLYHFYAMLQAIKKEIIAGPSNEEDLKTDSDVDDESDSGASDSSTESETARKTATAFRYHLRGLFGLLHQMTETAKFLCHRYESEVSPPHNGISSVSSFNL